MKLFRDESSYPKTNAQRNLVGITCYVEDATLRYHKARILSTHIFDNGLLFGLIESVALDMHNQTRGFRPVVFNVLGQVVSYVNLENCLKTRRAAEIALFAIVDGLDAKKLTLVAVKDRLKARKEEAQRFLASIAKL